MASRYTRKPDETMRSFFFRVIRFIKKNIFGVFRANIFQYDIENPGKKIESDLDLSFRLATKEDIAAMDEEHYDYDEKAREYSIDRLEKGDRCILAVYNNKIVGYLWSMRDTMELTQFKHIPLAKNRASSYKGFVLTDFRGKRIHPAMYNYLISILKKDGKRYIVSMVDLDNKSSIKTKQRGNYKVIGEIVHVRLFGFKYDFIKKQTIEYLQKP